MKNYANFADTAYQGLLRRLLLEGNIKDNRTGVKALSVFGANYTVNLINTTADASNTGYYSITSDTIYGILPENQLLRPFELIEQSTSYDVRCSVRVVDIAVKLEP